MFHELKWYSNVDVKSYFMEHSRDALKRYIYFHTISTGKKIMIKIGNGTKHWTVQHLTEWTKTPTNMNILT